MNDTLRMSTRDILIVLFKRRRLITVIFCSIVGLVTLYSVLVTPQYEANASILLKFGREYVYRPEVGTTQPQIELNREDLVTSEQQLLSSRARPRESGVPNGEQPPSSGLRTPAATFAPPHPL